MSETILERPLPIGWTIAQMKDLALYINGRSFKPSEWEDEGRPIIRIQNLTGTGKKLNRFSGNVEKKYEIFNGDLLISWSATLGAFIYHGEPAILNQHIFKVEPFIDKKFIYYLTNRIMSELKQKVHGSGMQHITKDPFETHAILLPPLNEQKRIVAKIEELFSLMDKIKETLQITLVKIKKIIQKILDDFTSHDSAQPCKLGDIADIRGGVTLGRKISGSTITLPYLRVANVQDGYLDLETIKEIEIRKEEKDKWQLLNGDILLTEGGDRDKLGRGTVWRGHIKNCIHQNHIFRVRLDPKKYDPDFVSFVLRSSTSKSFFERSGKQSVNLASINKTQLSSFEFRCPELSVQQQSKNIIQKGLDQCKNLELICDNLFKQLQELERSILDSAFKGRLVVQDPNDEPAEILLQKIKQEKQKIINSKPRKKKK